MTGAHRHFVWTSTAWVFFTILEEDEMDFIFDSLFCCDLLMGGRASKGTCTVVTGADGAWFHARGSRTTI
jgi:hypothetical protein